MDCYAIIVSTSWQPPPVPRTRFRTSSSRVDLKGIPDKGNARGAPGGVHPRAPMWMKPVTVMSVFIFSACVHEMVVYVAMRRTIVPINTYGLLVTAPFLVVWDNLYPVIGHGPKGNTPTPSCGSGAVNGAQGVGEPSGAVKRPRPPSGSYRGLGPVLAYGYGHLPTALLFDMYGWRWWRSAHGPE